MLPKCTYISELSLGPLPGVYGEIVLQAIVATGTTLRRIALASPWPLDERGHLQRWRWCDLQRTAAKMPSVRTLELDGLQHPSPSFWNDARQDHEALYPDPNSLVRATCTLPKVVLKHPSFKSNALSFLLISLPDLHTLVLHEPAYLSYTDIVLSLPLLGNLRELSLHFHDTSNFSDGLPEPIGVTDGIVQLLGDLRRLEKLKIACLDIDSARLLLAAGPALQSLTILDDAIANFVDVTTAVARFLRGRQSARTFSLPSAPMPVRWPVRLRARSPSRSMSRSRRRDDEYAVGSRQKGLSKLKLRPRSSWMRVHVQDLHELCEMAGIQLTWYGEVVG